VGIEVWHIGLILGGNSGAFVLYISWAERVK